MFRFLLLLLLSLSLSAQSLTLADLSFIVQKHDKISVILGSDVNKALTVDFPSVYNQKNYLPLLKSVLASNNLFIRFENGVYHVNSTPPESKPDNVGELLPPPPMLPSSGSVSLSHLDNNISVFDYNLTSYKLKFLQIDNVKPILDFSGIPYTFSTVSKTVIFKQTKDNSKAIPKLFEQLELIDIKKDQVTLKITIFDSNSEKVREVGINPSISFDFSLLSQSGALLTGDAVGAFNGSLKLLSTKGATNISHSTAYLISDSEKLDFKKVVSLPFLDEDFALTTDNGTNQSKKFKYRDIGFIVTAVPTIVNDQVYLDFSLSVGNVLSTGDLPTTSENSIKNKFSVKKGDLVLLAGISKDSLINNSESAPFLESIPILGDIFTHKTENSNKDYFNVSIEIN